MKIKSESVTKRSANPSDSDLWKSDEIHRIRKSDSKSVISLQFFTLWEWYTRSQNAKLGMGEEIRISASCNCDCLENCTIMASLNSICCRIGSQWRSCNTGVMWSNFLVPVITRAAEFWTAWSFFSKSSLTPYSRQLQIKSQLTETHTVHTSFYLVGFLWDSLKAASFPILDFLMY